MSRVTTDRVISSVKSPQFSS